SKLPFNVPTATSSTGPTVQCSVLSTSLSCLIERRESGSCCVWNWSVQVIDCSALPCPALIFLISQFLLHTQCCFSKHDAFSFQPSSTPFPLLREPCVFCVFYYSWK